MIQKKLRRVPLFKDLSNDELNEIKNITTVKKLSMGEILFYEGEEPNAFYALLEGDLKLYKTGLKSNEIVLHYFSTPTMIAEMATLESTPFPATAISTTDTTTVALIDKIKFLSLLQSNPVFSFHIIQSLTKKIKNLEVAINRNLIFDATLKVCSLLQENPTILKHSKSKDVANILNMAPETLSRIVTKFKKLNILDNDQKLIGGEKLALLLEF
ncbi:MAG: Crp/Fnr family transcriptional regulator [Sulfurimonas sp.]|jgi:CRP/FNR family transcriptional regulator